MLDDSPVVILLDNAGPTPFLAPSLSPKELLRLGREVRLAANDGPALNDVQVHDLPELIARATQVDAIFGALAPGIVNTGSCMPLLDLSNVSEALARATEDAGLLVFCGMGRGLRATGRRRLTSGPPGRFGQKP